jgi:hypothetical protein
MALCCDFQAIGHVRVCKEEKQRLTANGNFGCACDLGSIDFTLGNDHMTNLSRDQVVLLAGRCYASGL